MRQALIFLVLGAAAGVGTTMLVEREPLPALDGEAAAGTGSEAGVAELAKRMAALETALTEEKERRASLAVDLSQLGEQLGALTAINRTDVQGSDAGSGGDSTIISAVETVRGRQGRRFAALREKQAAEYRLNQLVEAGFAPDQAQSLIDRESKMRLELMNASYEARRQGEPFDPLAVQRESESQLRTELGDDAYARYLEATGQPTSVGIREVIENSAGQLAGLQPGDEIVGYNGERVFSLLDLRALTIAGEPGETVPVDILRNGQPMQMYISRGPLGIMGGGTFRGPGGTVFGSVRSIGP